MTEEIAFNVIQWANKTRREVFVRAMESVSADDFVILAEECLKQAGWSLGGWMRETNRSTDYAGSYDGEDGSESGEDDEENEDEEEGDERAGEPVGGSSRGGRGNKAPSPKQNQPKECTKDTESKAKNVPPTPTSLINGDYANDIISWMSDHEPDIIKELAKKMRYKETRDASPLAAACLERCGWTLGKWYEIAEQTRKVAREKRHLMGDTAESDEEGEFDESEQGEGSEVEVGGGKRKRDVEDVESGGEDELTSGGKKKAKKDEKTKLTKPEQISK